MLRAVTELKVMKPHKRKSTGRARVINDYSVKHLVTLTITGAGH